MITYFVYPILKCISTDKSFSFFCALPFNPSFTALSQRHPFYNPSLSRLLLLFFFFLTFPVSFSGFHYKCHSYPLPLCVIFFISLSVCPQVFLNPFLYFAIALSSCRFLYLAQFRRLLHSFLSNHCFFSPPACHSSLFCARLPPSSLTRPPIFISPFMPLHSRHSSPFEVCSAACAFVRLSTRACDWLCA